MTTAICPVCGTEVGLRLEGTFRKHGFKKNMSNSATFRPKVCEGSGKKLEELASAHEHRLGSTP